MSRSNKGRPPHDKRYTVTRTLKSVWCNGKSKLTCSVACSTVTYGTVTVTFGTVTFGTVTYGTVTVTFGTVTFGTVTYGTVT